jgi:hypothetical protein
VWSSGFRVEGLGVSVLGKGFRLLGFFVLTTPFQLLHDGVSRLLGSGSKSPV